MPASAYCDRGSRDPVGHMRSGDGPSVPSCRRTTAVGYRGVTACDAAGISYRQLDYWARTGLVVPSVRDASGSGTQRLYSFRDMVVLKVVKRLLDAGVSLQNIRKAIETLRSRGAEDLAGITLISDGTTVYECRSPEEVVDLLQGGQGVFGIAISGAFKEIQGSLARPAGRAGEVEPAVAPTPTSPRAMPPAPTSSPPAAPAAAPADLVHVADLRIRFGSHHDGSGCGQPLGSCPMRVPLTARRTLVVSFTGLLGLAAGCSSAGTVRVPRTLSPTPALPRPPPSPRTRLCSRPARWLRHH